MSRPHGATGGHQGERRRASAAASAARVADKGIARQRLDELVIFDRAGSVDVHGLPEQIDLPEPHCSIREHNSLHPLLQMP